MKKTRQVVLLRVGMDTGSGGMLGPIFADGRFEFIPIPTDNSSEALKRTYANTQGRYGRRFIEYFPSKRISMMRGRYLHFDPEFDTYTYGDPTRPKKSLKDLTRGDLLVFYAGLKGWDKCKTPPGLYIIGYFVVEEVLFHPDLKGKGVITKFKNNWHVLNRDKSKSLILVKGGKGSRLLKKASQNKRRQKGH